MAVLKAKTKVRKKKLKRQRNNETIRLSNEELYRIFK